MGSKDSEQENIEKLLQPLIQLTHSFTLNNSPVDKPEKITSYSFTYTVTNYFGITMGRITVWCNADQVGVCDVTNPQKGTNKPFTMPTVNVDASISVTRTRKEKDGCPDGFMEGYMFEFDVNFVGYLNNIPYLNFITIWGDGSMEWGPK